MANISNIDNFTLQDISKKGHEDNVILAYKQHFGPASTSPKTSLPNRQDWSRRGGQKKSRSMARKGRTPQDLACNIAYKTIIVKCVGSL